MENNIDLSAATTALTSLKDSLIAWLGPAAPYVVYIGGSFLIFYLLRYAYRLIRQIVVYK